MLSAKNGFQLPIPMLGPNSNCYSVWHSIFSIANFGQDRVEVLQKNSALLSSRTVGAYNTESDPNPKSDKRTISGRIFPPANLFFVVLKSRIWGKCHAWLSSPLAYSYIQPLSYLVSWIFPSLDVNVVSSVTTSGLDSRKQNKWDTLWVIFSVYVGPSRGFPGPYTSADVGPL